MAELMLGQPLFPGESGIDQLVEIIKVLGTPTRDQIRTMNPNYMEHKFPQIKPHPFNKVFRKADQNAIDLISCLLEYTPTERLSAIDAMVHPFFDELRDPATKFPDSRHPGAPVKDLPVLFDFTRHGMYNSSAIGCHFFAYQLQNSQLLHSSITDLSHSISVNLWPQEVLTSTILRRCQRRR